MYNSYQLNRVLQVGTNLQAQSKEIDKGLDDSLRILGPKHQVNIIVILTNIQDPSYRHAVENAW